MSTNEKAPAAASGQGATVILELIALARWAADLYKDSGVLDFGVCGNLQVHMRATNYFDMFGCGACDNEKHLKYDRYSTVVQGVEFFCLVEKEGA